MKVLSKMTFIAKYGRIRFIRSFFDNFLKGVYKKN